MGLNLEASTQGPSIGPLLTLASSYERIRHTVLSSQLNRSGDELV